MLWLQSATISHPQCHKNRVIETVKSQTGKCMCADNVILLIMCNCLVIICLWLFLTHSCLANYLWQMYITTHRYQYFLLIGRPNAGTNLTQTEHLKQYNKKDSSLLFQKSVINWGTGVWCADFHSWIIRAQNPISNSVESRRYWRNSCYYSVQNSLALHFIFKVTSDSSSSLSVA
jgi:hypothetical protein